MDPPSHMYHVFLNKQNRKILYKSLLFHGIKKDNFYNVIKLKRCMYMEFSPYFIFNLIEKNHCLGYEAAMLVRLGNNVI